VSAQSSCDECAIEYRARRTCEYALDGIRMFAPTEIMIGLLRYTLINNAGLHMYTIGLMLATSNMGFSVVLLTLAPVFFSYDWTYTHREHGMLNESPLNLNNMGFLIRMMCTPLIIVWVLWGRRHK
jgi:hypothetical protein